MKPAFRILADGNDITAKINDRLMRLTVTDEAGVESDAVEIEIDDRGWVVEAPRKGAMLQVFMGYRETGLDLMGAFTVDDVSMEGPPWTMSITGRAADLRETFKEQRTRHYENTTVGAVIEQVAKRHGLRPAISPELASRRIAYLAQTEESDLHLLTRLGRRHDAIGKPANGRLVFARRGTGRSGSGLELPQLVLRPGDITKVRASGPDRPKHGSVEAEWYDRDEAERKTIIVQHGSEGPRMKLPHPYPSEEEAERAADARSRELQRAEGSLSVDMPGRTLIAAEMPVTMEGFRDGITGTWTTARAEHSIDGQGYRTSFEAEKGKKGDGEDDDEEEDDDSDD